METTHQRPAHVQDLNTAQPRGRVMNATWGVYNVRGRLAGGTETEATDRKAVSYFVRWRVNGKMHRRTFETRGYANTFREKLIAAKSLGWAADERGWPIDPSEPVAMVAPTAGTAQPLTGSLPGTPPVVAHTFESYVEAVWWPTIRGNLGDKNRMGHRRNADVAIQLLRLAEGDPRVAAGLGQPDDSIPMWLVTADDVRATVVARGHINGRTAAVNRRRLDKALAAAGESGVVDVVTEPEVASAATVRSFYVTLGMIFKAAGASNHTTGDPMQETSAFAPKPRPASMSQRLVPSIAELFDLADCIARLGPLMSDGRHRGARFGSLLLCAGTTAPRPGELVAHRPDWFEWHPGAPDPVPRD